MTLQEEYENDRNEEGFIENERNAASLAHAVSSAITFFFLYLLLFVWCGWHVAAKIVCIFFVFFPFFDIFLIPSVIYALFNLPKAPYKRAACIYVTIRVILSVFIVWFYIVKILMKN